MQPLPPGRRPNHVIAAEVRRKREEIREFMDQGGLDQGDVATLIGFSKSSISRALSAEPARETRCLRKLHTFVSTSKTAEMSHALSAIEQFADSVEVLNGATAAQILRAVADLLDKRNTKEP